MYLTVLILYAVLGLMVGALNYLVEEGDPGNESPHWLNIARSIGIGLIWLPYTVVAAFPRRGHLLQPKVPPHAPGPVA
jgi:hypothetical protein